MTVSRGWTPKEDDPRWDDEGYYDEVKARLDGLMKWWSQLATEAEQDQWARERAFEEGGYDGEDYPRASWFNLGEEDPEYIAECKVIDDAVKAQNDARRAKDEMARAQVEFIENQIYSLGARIMRPYEHWNEEERYVEYMENRGY